MNKIELEDVQRGARVAKKEFGLDRLAEGVDELVNDRNDLFKALVAIEQDTIVIENTESLRNKIRTTASQAIIKSAKI